MEIQHTMVWQWKIFEIHEMYIKMKFDAKYFYYVVVVVWNILQIIFCQDILYAENIAF